MNVNRITNLEYHKLDPTTYKVLKTIELYNQVRFSLSTQYRIKPIVVRSKPILAADNNYDIYIHASLSYGYTDGDYDSLIKLNTVLGFEKLKVELKVNLLISNIKMFNLYHKHRVMKKSFKISFSLTIKS